MNLIVIKLLQIRFKIDNSDISSDRFSGHNLFFGEET